jgi:hypothetical protein
VVAWVGVVVVLAGSVEGAAVVAGSVVGPVVDDPGITSDSEHAARAIPASNAAATRARRGEDERAMAGR